MSYARQAVICEPCLLSVCEKAARRISVIVVLCPSSGCHLLFGRNFTEENIMKL